MKELNQNEYLIFTESLKILMDSKGNIISSTELTEHENFRGQSLENNGFVIYKNESRTDQLIIDVYDDSANLVESKNINLEEEYYCCSIQLLYLNDDSLLELRNGTLIKYDSTGQLVWKERHYFDAFNDLSIIETKDKNIVVVGQDNRSTESEIGYVAKLDQDNGSIIWEQSYAFNDVDIKLDQIIQAEDHYMRI